MVPNSVMTEPISIPTAFLEQWNVRKPSVSGMNGVVATQHYLASEVGASVMRRGGNAIDASVAAGLALGVVEPWMSGIGGGGFMTIYLAEQDAVSVVEFGMKAPLGSTPDDYPLSGRATGASSFNWPEVKGNVNVHGPLSIAVPGYVKGLALALERFGTWDWQDVIEPACQIAETGLPMNWYATQMIINNARLMRNYEEIGRTYLPDGLPLPSLDAKGETLRVPLGNLSTTYKTLQREGPDSYYSGSLADSIASDLESAGSKIRKRDLEEYEAFVDEPLVAKYRSNTLSAPRRRSAGPTLERTLNELEGKLNPHGRNAPNSSDYQTYVQTLLDAYAYRLENLGDGEKRKVSGATSHLCTADSRGNLVSHTQTIMSTFGSQVMLPKTGIVMNNGMMWFDPVPNRPNSVAGGRRPLSNMCPVIGELANGSRFAVGACGGRTIFPAVYQLISFLCDFGMSVDEAIHQARVDVSGTELVSIMETMDESSTQALRDRFPQTRVRSYGVSPVLFGVPQLVVRDRSGSASGGCFVPSPTAAVVAA